MPFLSIPQQAKNCFLLQDLYYKFAWAGHFLYHIFVKTLPAWTEEKDAAQLNFAAASAVNVTSPCG
ncbi:hypothetical protein CA264_15095 [Pontibacter actiniarum]|uniref:Uncharacterized protein n=1 Tax=Pontibacter actiniarum TaxID=323450 RepID=A0A1X9YUP4_9BACT|nr:hypothetical protein CA264_15095 [Pontibacter actiniarum]